jgi:hypothetical protein
VSHHFAEIELRSTPMPERKSADEIDPAIVARVLSANGRKAARASWEATTDRTARTAPGREASLRVRAARAAARTAATGDAA